MENESEIQNPASEAPKRPLSPSEKAPSKKVRLSFSGKEFRKKLKTQEKLQGKCLYSS